MLDLIGAITSAQPPALLGALPRLEPGTVFLVLLSLCAIAAVWGALQLLAVLRGADEDTIERRLGLSNAMASDAALLVKSADRPAWLEGSDQLQKFGMRLDLAFPGQTVTKFLVITAVCALALGILASLVLGVLPYGIAAAAAGAAIPYIRFRLAYGKRQRIMADQLIEALDFMSRVLRAGHSLAAGLNMIGEELPEPIASEFRRCYEQHNLGVSLEDALVEMARRVDLDDFAFFVTSVSIQRQTGGDLAEILDNINGMIRARIRLSQHVKALTAEGRFSGYVLTGLPLLIFVLMYLMNPDYGSELVVRPQGRLMLGAAALLQVFGLLVIRKIVNIRA